MRIYAFLGTLFSIAMLVLMNVVYAPLMDANTTPVLDRVLMTITMIFPLYFLFFSVKVMLRVGSIFKWEPEEEITRKR